ncbi:MAG: ABC transporter ATP-binding protein [Firmicutes bacterium]|jgi:teichoic acid transport system ATP-binding protein|nr:ABC transporter ATP-binding protein [Bacillota bacterium]
MDNSAIIFENVTKTYKLYKSDKARFLGIFTKKIKYKENKAINNMSFNILKGEGVAFLGKNGAGKSTIMKMITGVSFPTEGEIIVNGRVSALLELTAGFDGEFSGRENIYLKCNLMGMNDNEIKDLEPAIVEFADIGDYIDQPVRTYSSGMKARLGFAINANVEPEILIVDEALSVGDKSFRKKCMNKVSEIMNSGDVTFLFVTHSLESAREFCKRGIVMDKGKIIFDGEIMKAIEVYGGL